MGMRVSFTLSSAFGTLLLLLSCFTQPRYEGLCHSYCILLCHVQWLSMGGLLFLKGNRSRESGENGNRGIGKSNGKGNCNWSGCIENKQLPPKNNNNKRKERKKKMYNLIFQPRTLG